MTMKMNKKHKCIIVGSGPAGYTAAIYAARAGMEPLLIRGPQPGGLLTTTADVENFPGYPKGVDGTALTMDLHEQACRFGTQIVPKTVVGILPVDGYVSLQTDDGEFYDAHTVIIATGAKPKWLGADGEQELYGSGVSFCAVCDGFFYRDQDVVVIGGGDSACEEALYLANICNSVTMLVRSDKMRASRIMQNRVLTNEKIKVMYKCGTPAFVNKNYASASDGHTNTLAYVIVDQVVPMPEWPEEEESQDPEKFYSNIRPTKCVQRHAIAATGAFIAIGHTPATEPFKGVLAMDNDGYIITAPGSTMTSVLGVFAAGDCQDRVFRQAITAAGSGCMAALEAERYLSEIQSQLQNNG